MYVHVCINFQHSKTVFWNLRSSSNLFFGKSDNHRAVPSVHTCSVTRFIAGWLVLPPTTLKGCCFLVIDWTVGIHYTQNEAGNNGSQRNLHSVLEAIVFAHKRLKDVLNTYQTHFSNKFNISLLMETIFKSIQKKKGVLRTYENIQCW